MGCGEGRENRPRSRHCDRRNAESQDTLPHRSSRHSSRERVRHSWPRVSREAFLFFMTKTETMRAEFTLRLRQRAKGATFIRCRPAAYFAFIALLIAIPGGSVSAGQSGAASSPGRVLTDEMGRKVQLPQQVDRIVSLAPNLTEIVFALGEG